MAQEESSRATRRRNWAYWKSVLASWWPLGFAVNERADFRERPGCPGSLLTDASNDEILREACHSSASREGTLCRIGTIRSEVHCQAADLGREVSTHCPPNSRSRKELASRRHDSLLEPLEAMA